MSNCYRATHCQRSYWRFSVSHNRFPICFILHVAWLRVCMFYLNQMFRPISFPFLNSDSVIQVTDRGCLVIRFSSEVLQFGLVLNFRSLCWSLADAVDVLYMLRLKSIQFSFSFRLPNTLQILCGFSA